MQVGRQLQTPSMGSAMQKEAMLVRYLIKEGDWLLRQQSSTRPGYHGYICFHTATLVISWAAMHTPKCTIMCLLMRSLCSSVHLPLKSWALHWLQPGHRKSTHAIWWHTSTIDSIVLVTLQSGSLTRGHPLECWVTAAPSASSCGNWSLHFLSYPIN